MTATPTPQTITNDCDSGHSVQTLVRLPSRERGCEGKANLGRNYVRQADKLSVKHGKQYGVYRCPHCGGAHLTTKLFKADQYADLLHITEPNVQAQGIEHP